MVSQVEPQEYTILVEEAGSVQGRVCVLIRKSEVWSLYCRVEEAAVSMKVPSPLYTSLLILIKLVWRR